MTEREAKIAALHYWRQTLDARLRVATDAERPGLEVALRMCGQLLARLERTP